MFCHRSLISWQTAIFVMPRWPNIWRSLSVVWVDRPTCSPSILINHLTLIFCGNVRIRMLDLETTHMLLVRYAQLFGGRAAFVHGWICDACCPNGDGPLLGRWIAIGVAVRGLRVLLQWRELELFGEILRRKFVLGNLWVCFELFPFVGVLLLFVENFQNTIFVFLTQFLHEHLGLMRIIDYNLVQDEFPQDFFIECVILKFEIKVFDWTWFDNLIIVQWVIEVFQEGVAEDLLGCESFSWIIGHQFFDDSNTHLNC